MVLTSLVCCEDEMCAVRISASMTLNNVCNIGITQTDFEFELLIRLEERTSGNGEMGYING